MRYLPLISTNRWSGSPLRELLVFFAEKLFATNFLTFGVVCWAIWKHRNKLHLWLPNTFIEEKIDLLKLYLVEVSSFGCKLENPRVSDFSLRPSLGGASIREDITLQSWIMLLCGFFKLNVDVVCNPNMEGIKYGVVIHNGWGEVVAT